MNKLDPALPVARYADLDGAGVLVTGGANGIGAAIVQAFRAQGAHVFFCDVDSTAGTALAKKTGATFHRVDLMREREVVQWVKNIARSADSIQTLVNNAASDPRIPFLETTTQAWDELFARNLRAYFLAARESVPHMKPPAAIINLASITFHIAPAQMAAYVATKGGVLGFTRSLARELGPRGIRVNTISPGWIMTERQLRQFVTPSVKKLIRKSQCIPTLLQPSDIAEVTLFLASSASSALTGQEILADRGWSHS